MRNSKTCNGASSNADGNGFGCGEGGAGAGIALLLATIACADVPEELAAVCVGNADTNARPPTPTSTEDAHAADELADG